MRGSQDMQIRKQMKIKTFRMQLAGRHSATLKKSDSTVNSINGEQTQIFEAIVTAT